MKWQTALVQFDPAPGDPHAPSVTPIYQTATFRLPSATEAGGYDYSRSGNPTRDVLEAQLAHLESGQRGFAFASGMAAIDAAISLIPAGGTVIAGDDLYGGTFRYLDRLAPARGQRSRFVDTTDPEALESAMSTLDGPCLVLIETPSNPRMTISDLERCAAIVHRYEGLLAVDNSLMSPYLQRPLELGADVVIHSATKFLSGHGHTTAGAVVTRDEDLGARIAWHQNATGSALGPFDCWLLISGLKTLAVRLERQQSTAVRLARSLAAHPAVDAVCYPTLDGHPGAGLHRSQATGGGAVVTVRLDNPNLGRQLVESTRYFQVAVSFGSVGSSIELPATMSHAPLASKPGAAPFDNAWVRLSVGLEDPEDLESDLLAVLAVGSLDRRRRPAEAGRRSQIEANKSSTGSL